LQPYFFNNEAADRNWLLHYQANLYQKPLLWQIDEAPPR